MALGVTRVQPRFEDPRQLLGDRLRGIYRFLAYYGGRLFPDDYFADLHKESSRGRPTGWAPGFGALPGCFNHQELPR